MIDKNDFNEIAFDDEANLIKDVSMFLMLNKKNVDEADDVSETNLIWWSRICLCNLMLLANLIEQQRHAKTLKWAASSVYKRAFSFTFW